MRIAISTDSGSGISQEESRALGIRVVPMPFWIDGEEYYEGINLSREAFFEMLREERDISTSQPSPEAVVEAWDELLSEHDALIHVPLTAGLSGATQTAIMLSQEKKYQGRVFVPDSRGVSITQRQHCLFAKALAARGFAPEEIRQILEREAGANSIYIGLDTLKYLKNGGRITPMAAAIGTLLHIKPVLTIVRGGKLDSYARVRTAKQMREVIVAGLQEDLRKKLRDPDMRRFYLGVAYTDNREQAESFAAELAGLFPHRLNPAIVVNPLSLLISCHIGPNGIGAAVAEELPELLEPAPGAAR